jgi:uncharacterized protein (DUF362 family)
MIKVGLVRGDDRYRNVAAALEEIADTVVIPDKPVLIKPNFVSVHNQLCATHVEAVRATLDFLKSKGVERFTIGEGPAIGSADEGFDNYGYRTLSQDYKVTFLNLNTDAPTKVPAFDEVLGQQWLNISRTVAESYVVSVCPMKTHNNVVVTLGLKNVLVGMLSGRDEKAKIHAGSQAINLTLAKMAQHAAPSLAVIDGTVGMQGDGPLDGVPIASRCVVAAAHPIAADVVGLEVMGFRLEQVGYLRYAMELRGLTLSDIEVSGQTIEACRVKFRPHQNIASQLDWPLEGDWRTVFDRVG